MDQIINYHEDGTSFPLFSRSRISAVTAATQQTELLGVDVCNLTVTAATPLPFRVNDTIQIYGKEYFLTDFPTAKKESVFEYTLIYKGPQYRLIKVQLRDFDDTGISVQGGDFSLMGNLKDQATLIIRNLKRFYGVLAWELGDCPDTDYRNMTYSSENCLQALQEICSSDNFNIEFEIELVNGTNYLHLRTVGKILPDIFKYGRARGLYSVIRNQTDDKAIVNRLFAQGGTTNIRPGYRNGSTALQLPLDKILDDNNRYIEDADSIAAFGKSEGSETFEEYFPQRTGTVTALGDTLLEFYDDTMDFDLFATDDQGNSLYLSSGATAKISFVSGGLAGYEFEINKTLGYDHTTKKYKLLQYTTETGLVLPTESSSAFQIKVGDKYKILDIYLPDQYVTNAENDLYDATLNVLKTTAKSRSTFSVSVTRQYLAAKAGTGSIVNYFGQGDTLQVDEEDLNLTSSSRILGFTRNILTDYDYDLTLGDEVSINVITQIIQEQNNVSKVIQINDLVNPVRAKQKTKNWMETLANMFDANGQFDGANIAPNTIQTQMLVVGARASNFILKDVVINPNIGGNPNIISVSSGQLIHLDPDITPGTWAITELEATTLQNDNLYFIYARCNRTNSEEAIIIFSKDQVVFDSQPNYYFFRIGVLNSVIDGVRGITTTYGVATINGKFITAGEIQSTDGSYYLSLDGNRFKVGDDNSGIEWNADGLRNFIIRGGLLQRSGGELVPLAGFRGEYDATITYYPGDSVVYNGVTYTFKPDITPKKGVSPLDTNTWLVSSAKGENGNRIEIRYSNNGSPTIPPSLDRSTRNPSGWSTATPANSLTSYVWYISAEIKGDNTLNGSWSKPVRLTGSIGKNGASLIGRGVWDETKQYHGTENIVEAVQYNGIWYITRSDAGDIAIGTLPTNLNYFNAFGAQFESIATGLLLAQQAYIQNIIVDSLKTATNGQRIEILKDNNSLKFYDGSTENPNAVVTIDAQPTINGYGGGAGLSAFNATYKGGSVTLNGVFSNASKQIFLPASSGIGNSASIVGLLQSRLQDSNSMSAAVVGIDQTSLVSGYGIAFGGYFNSIFIGDLNLKARYINVSSSQTITVNKDDTDIYCYNSADITLQLPYMQLSSDSPAWNNSVIQRAKPIFVHQVNLSKVTINAATGNQILRNSGANSNVTMDSRGECAVFFWNGSHWLVHKLTTY